MSAQSISINTDILQEHIQTVRDALQKLDKMPAERYELPLNKGDAKNIVRIFNDDMNTITDLTRELLQSYVNVVQAAHGEYVGADTELSRMFREK